MAHLTTPEVKCGSLFVRRRWLRNCAATANLSVLKTELTPRSCQCPVRAPTGKGASPLGVVAIGVEWQLLVAPHQPPTGRGA